jgi:hypothetical protein
MKQARPETKAENRLKSDRFCDGVYNLLFDIFPINFSLPAPDRPDNPVSCPVHSIGCGEDSQNEQNFFG